MSLAHTPLRSNYTPASSTVVKSLSGQTAQQSAGASLSNATDSTPTLTIPQIQEAMRRGLVKAAAEHLVAYRDGSDFLVPSSVDPTTEYRVVKTGHQWFAWSCSCQAGQHARICKHVSLAVLCTKYGVHAKRPVVVSRALVQIEDLRVARNAALARCTDCDQLATPGFALCGSCAAARNRIWDEQDAAYNLPLHRSR